jgi:hypothetical protein
MYAHEVVVKPENIQSRLNAPERFRAMPPDTRPSEEAVEALNRVDPPVVLVLGQPVNLCFRHELFDRFAMTDVSIAVDDKWVLLGHFPRIIESQFSTFLFSVREKTPGQPEARPER